MSANAIEIRVTDEALVALLILAALGIVGSLFAVVKIAGKWLVGFTGEIAGWGVGGTKEQDVVEDVSDGIRSAHSDYSSRGDNNSFVSRPQKRRHIELNKPDNNNEPFQQDTHPEAQSQQLQREWDREEGITAIRAWENSTATRFLQEKARGLPQLPSLVRLESGRQGGQQGVVEEDVLLVL